MPYLQQALPWLRHLAEQDARLGRWLAKILLYYVGEQSTIKDFEVFEHLICQELPTTGADMQTAFEDLKQKAEAVGIEKGLEKGLEKGKSIGLEEGKSIGLEEGKSIGLEKGKDIGAENARLQLAKRLLARGMSLEEISHLTDLSSATIRSLEEVSEQVA